MELGSGGDVTGEQTALEVKGQSKHTALAERADAGPRVLSGPALPSAVSFWLTPPAECKVSVSKWLVLPE